MSLKIEINIYKYDGENEYVKMESISESWKKDMSIEDLKDLIEESTCNLAEDQRFFWAGIYLPDDTKLSPDWDMQQLIALDVIVDKKGKEASVMSKLDHKVWIVTGKGKEFSWYPVPDGSSQEIRLNSKGLIPWIPHITTDVHFLLCIENGEDDGRWQGKSYTVKGHGNDFTLILEQAGTEIKVLVSVSTTKEREELIASEESKVYFQAHMDERERLIQHIAVGATVASVPIGLASLCCIM